MRATKGRAQLDAASRAQVDSGMSPISDKADCAVTPTTFVARGGVVVVVERVEMAPTLPAWARCQADVVRGWVE